VFNLSLLSSESKDMRQFVRNAILKNTLQWDLLPNHDTLRDMDVSFEGHTDPKGKKNLLIVDEHTAESAKKRAAKKSELTADESTKKRRTNTPAAQPAKKRAAEKSELTANESTKKRRTNTPAAQPTSMHLKVSIMPLLWVFSKFFDKDSDSFSIF